MEPNWKNQTLWTGDNLDIMRGMNSESVDLIYLDPPFNSNRNYAAPIGSEAAGAAFKDIWDLSDVDDAWHGEIADSHPALYSIIDASRLAHGKGMKSYLIMMTIRLLEMHRILKMTGSIYLHCDDNASHYLKLVMDCVFGKNNFRNEIIWCYTGPSNTKRWFPRKHDTILFYVKSNKALFYRDHVRRPYKAAYTAARGVHGARKGEDTEEKRQLHKKGSVPTDWWADGYLSNISAYRSELTGYPTKKPLTLLERIIKASSTENDVVLDPFCGCATTCIASEKLNRQWAGIDISSKALYLVKLRLQQNMFTQNVIHRTDIPKRTDMGKIAPYKTQKHTIFGKYEGICQGCKISFPFRNMTIDHIIPKSKGGTDHIDNLQILCAACNSEK